MYLPTIAAVLLIAVASVHGNATGAPADACEDLTPQHGADAQKTRSPYIIDIEKNGIKAGGSTKVTIKGKTGEQFKGFIMQARVGRTPVGKFSTTDKNTKVVDCGTAKENTVTHTNPDNKKEVTVTWTAPKNLKEQVIFYLSVVKEGQVFWVAQKSRTLNVH
nr:putative defense protein 3 [Halyomorpha halys]